MPKKPARYGANRRARRSVRDQARKERNSNADQNRDREVRRLYDRKWSQYSKQLRRDYPLCVLHAQRREVVLAQVTDHWQPHKGDVDLFWDENNHAPLCKHCHDVEKRRMEVAWSKGSPIAPRPRLYTVAEYIRILNGSWPQT